MKEIIKHVAPIYIFFTFPSPQRLKTVEKDVLEKGGSLEGGLCTGYSTNGGVSALPLGKGNLAVSFAWERGSPEVEFCWAVVGSSVHR